jgi:hypothetical protein
MSLEWIRRYYSVPAKRGGRITFRGESGRITGSRGQYLLARLDAEPKILLNLHATWEVVYVNPAQESSTHSITDERTAV